MRGCGGGGGRSAAGRALNRRGGFHIRPRVFAPLQFPGPPPRFPRLRRAGVHARRTTAISKSERPRRRGVRRDGGIPPYGRPGGGGHPGWSKAQNLFVGAGFTAPAGAFRRPTAAQRQLLGRRSRPGRSRRHEVPGTMQASSPTRVCNAAGLWFPVWPCAVPPVVGADSISARGPLRRCEVPGLPPRFPRLRRAGVHARRTLAISKPKRPRRRRVRWDGGIPPYDRPGGGGRPGWPKT